MFSIYELELLNKILHFQKLIYYELAKRGSATLTTTNGKGESMATILVGGTANSLFQEWSGPNGTGEVLPNAGAVSYVSSDPTIATVDPNSGLITGIALGTATITGTDAANNLAASAPVTVTEVAQSATLTITANGSAPAAKVAPKASLSEPAASEVKR